MRNGTTLISIPHGAFLFNVLRKLLVFIALFVFAFAKAQSAEEIIQQAINAKAENDPFSSKTQISFRQYRQVKITGNPENISGNSKKSEMLRNTLRRSHVFLTEKLSDFYVIDGELKEIVRGANLSGFKDPVYRVYSVEILSQSLYDEHYVIFDTEYAGPLDDDGLDNYDYTVTENAVLQEREVLKVSFKPKEDSKIALLEGQLTIDKKTFAVADARLKLKGGLRVNAHHSFSYNLDYGKWLPVRQDLFIVQSNNEKKIALLGGQIAVGSLDDLPENEEGAEVQELSKNLYLQLTSVNQGFARQQPDYNLHGLKVFFQPVTTSRKDTIDWERYRVSPLSRRDALTFTSVDSLVQAQNIPRKLEVIDKFKQGYFPLSIFDIDLKSLIKYNDYEKLRLGLGVQTNDGFMENYQIGGYLAYGFGDEQFKYGTNFKVRLHQRTDTWLKFAFDDHIEELGNSSFLTDARVYSVFEPRLVNLTTFYDFRSYSVGLLQRWHPKVLSEVSLSRKRIAQLTSYRYLNNDRLFDNYILSEVTVAARWAPFSDFLYSPNGYFTVNTGYPILSMQLTKGISDVVGSDFNYFKASAKAIYQINRLDKSHTEFFVEGHWASGDVPLTHLFHAYPNAPNAAKVLQRFSVAGRQSFETMFFNEFFSDRLVMGQMRHSLAPWNIATFSKPQMVFVTRYALGDMDDRETHLGLPFDTLNEGYAEAGVEVNQLLYGFGLGFFYRMGAYHLPNPADNIALKFTFYLDL